METIFGAPFLLADPPGTDLMTVMLFPGFTRTRPRFGLRVVERKLSARAEFGRWP